MAIELVKENIEYEQLLGENTADNVIKAEYVIPDTLPDVKEILMLDANPSITSIEVMQDKVYIEGQILYNILYLSKEEKNEVFSVNYMGKFTNYIEVNGSAHKMLCESECSIEHMGCSCVNERKIALEGIVKVKAKVMKNCSFDIVEDIKHSNDVQLLKNPTSIDKIIGEVKGNLVGKSHLVIPMDKPQIKSILKLDVNLHKREIRVIENKVEVDTFALLEVIYKGDGDRDIEYLSDDILIRQEMELQGANSSMDGFGDFILQNVEHNIKEDDLGESRILDVELNIRADVKVTTKENVDIIEDAYSPAMALNMVKKDYVFNVVHGIRGSETIVKENLPVRNKNTKPQSVILSRGKVCVTDKKLVENKAVIEGLLQVNVLYKVDDETRYVDAIEEEVPFTFTTEIPGAKIDMSCNSRLFLESLEGFVEAGTIGIKAVISSETKVSYESRKDFIVNVEELEEVMPIKKSSITIYCVQPGDTMWKIAKRYSIPMDNLIKVNSIDDIENIAGGQKLIIPGRALI
jgi:LysM repeat protein